MPTAQQCDCDELGRALKDLMELVKRHEEAFHDYGFFLPDDYGYKKQAQLALARYFHDSHHMSPFGELEECNREECWRARDALGIPKREIT